MISQSFRARIIPASRTQILQRIADFWRVGLRSVSTCVLAQLRSKILLLDHHCGQGRVGLAAGRHNFRDLGPRVLWDPGAGLYKSPYISPPKANSKRPGLVFMDRVITVIRTRCQCLRLPRVSDTSTEIGDRLLEGRRNPDYWLPTFSDFSTFLSGNPARSAQATGRPTLKPPSLQRFYQSLSAKLSQPSAGPRMRILHQGELCHSRGVVLAQRIERSTGTSDDTRRSILLSKNRQSRVTGSSGAAALTKFGRTVLR